MLALGAALEQIRAAIEACGVTCVLDPADLGELPGAWVEPSSDDSTPVLFDTIGADSYTLSCTLFLIVADNGMVESYNALSELLGKIRLPLSIQSARFVSIALQNLSGGSSLPALSVPLSYHITPEE